MARKPAPKSPSLPPAQTPFAERSAEELAVLAQRDNLAAYGELVARYEARLFNFLLRRVSRRVDAEDLTQEAFVRAWERIASYDPTWRFSTWLFTIASRLAVSEHRKFKPTMHIESAEQVRARAGASDRDRDAEADIRGGSRLWALARQVLRDEQHTSLWLRYAEDMSIGEIAKVMGKSQVGVRVALFRARQTLAQAAANQELNLGQAAKIDDEGQGKRSGSGGTAARTHKELDGFEGSAFERLASVGIERGTGTPMQSRNGGVFK